MTKLTLMTVAAFLFAAAARAETLDLAPDLSPPARVVTLGEPPPAANPRWIQLRMDFDKLLPEGLLGWRDDSFRTKEPKDSFSNANGQFNFNIGYQF